MGISSFVFLETSSFVFLETFLVFLETSREDICPRLSLQNKADPGPVKEGPGNLHRPDHRIPNNAALITAYWKMSNADSTGSKRWTFDLVKKFISLDVVEPVSVKTILSQIPTKEIRTCR